MGHCDNRSKFVITSDLHQGQYIQAACTMWENQCRQQDGEYSTRESDAEKGYKDGDALYEEIEHTKVVASREYTIWLSIG